MNAKTTTVLALAILASCELSTAQVVTHQAAAWGGPITPAEGWHLVECPTDSQGATYTGPVVLTYGEFDGPCGPAGCGTVEIGAPLRCYVKVKKVTCEVHEHWGPEVSNEAYAVTGETYPGCGSGHDSCRYSGGIVTRARFYGWACFYDDQWFTTDRPGAIESFVANASWPWAAGKAAEAANQGLSWQQAVSNNLPEVPVSSWDSEIAAGLYTMNVIMTWPQMAVGCSNGNGAATAASTCLADMEAIPGRNPNGQWSNNAHTGWAAVVTPTCSIPFDPDQWLDVLTKTAYKGRGPHDCPETICFTGQLMLPQLTLEFSGQCVDATTGAKMTFQQWGCAQLGRGSCGVIAYAVRAQLPCQLLHSRCPVVDSNELSVWLQYPDAAATATQTVASPTETATLSASSTLLPTTILTSSIDVQNSTSTTEMALSTSTTAPGGTSEVGTTGNSPTTSTLETANTTAAIVTSFTGVPASTTVQATTTTTVAPGTSSGSSTSTTTEEATPTSASGTTSSTTTTSEAVTSTTGSAETSTEVPSTTADPSTMSSSPVEPSTTTTTTTEAETTAADTTAAETNASTTAEITTQPGNTTSAVTYAPAQYPQGDCEILQGNTTHTAHDWCIICLWLGCFWTVDGDCRLNTPFNTVTYAGGAAFTEDQCPP